MNDYLFYIQCLILVRLMCHPYTVTMYSMSEVINFVKIEAESAEIC